MHFNWIKNALKLQFLAYAAYDMPRLNSEDFSKFFLCLDILFSTHLFESTRQEMHKNANFFRIFLNVHDFFNFFEVFRVKTFLHSDAQTPDMHH